MPAKRFKHSLPSVGSGSDAIHKSPQVCDPDPVRDPVLLIRLMASRRLLTLQLLAPGRVDMRENCKSAASV